MMQVTASKDWEIRPGGMVVQKRTDEEQHRFRSSPPPTIRVRVKFGSVCHEMAISSQACFGDLKRMLSGRTGLKEEEQKIYYKDKERNSKEFLDCAGVKDRSKMVLMEDPISQEKRSVEMRKKAYYMDKAAKSISLITLEVDALSAQVSALESVISQGVEKVDDKDANNLIDLLMNQLLKLDTILVEGVTELQRKIQVKRIQKYVERIDALKLKMKNSQKQKQQQQQCYSAEIELAPVVVTSHWETFD